MNALHIALICVFSLSSFSKEVVFVHGNGVDASFWHEAQDSLAADVEKRFGKDNVHYANYLTEAEVEEPYKNYHSPRLYKKIKKAFDEARPEKLIIVAHSFGVSLTLATFEYYKLWNRVDKFIALAGAVRGLQSCKAFGPYNKFSPTCYGQSKRDPFVFGFYPGYLKINDWTANYYYSMRNMPGLHRDVDFVTFTIGKDDSIVCRTYYSDPICVKSGMFNEFVNVKNYDLQGKGLTHFTLPDRMDRNLIMNLLGE
ncbi:MAG: hypothetical protein CME64_08280 [Halobacteriovoraceae bacterium]|nr:hypothetical protein [Halobacteriovoraceae bacterium]|tara:strand:- start:201151 stop:201915 length:765 start_codon:yes stop_codon:yes gene_type:complete